MWGNASSAPYKIDQWSFTVHVLRTYGIQNTARRSSHGLATQQVGYNQTKEINSGSANCNHTHNIISLLVPDVFNVIFKTTVDEFNLIHTQDTGSNSVSQHLHTSSIGKYVAYVGEITWTNCRQSI